MYAMPMSNVTLIVSLTECDLNRKHSGNTNGEWPPFVKNLTFIYKYDVQCTLSSV